MLKNYLKNKEGIYNEKYIICILILLLSITLVSCSSSQVKYWGMLYNSNDGTCSITGKSLDFYVDTKFRVTIEAGYSSMIKLAEGEHVFKVLLTETQEVLWDDYVMNITQNGWWFRYGCNDGTYPRD